MPAPASTNYALGDKNSEYPATICSIWRASLTDLYRSMLLYFRVGKRDFALYYVFWRYSRATH